MTLQCPSGKKRHSSVERAKAAAHVFARELNREGVIAYTMYAYRCDKCRGGWHLTRQAGWPGVIQVMQAAPERLQRWSIGEADDGTATL